MTDTENAPRRADRFVAHLRALAEREDRGALAALRKSLQAADGMATDAYPYVVPFLDVEPSRRDRAFFLIGALFATHPDPGGVSLGLAFRRLSPDDPNNESVRRRFVALLDADPDDVGEHLHQATSLCRARGIAIDWARTLEDLLAFSHPDRFAQRRLAREFWATHQDVDSTKETQT
ncbi:MAG: type I-E CRISPR-associated protein Cse2/CasB [Deltaproteobacteria bacterium]|nr:type I-E CRISPR-associated protein Cse2/CasB [Deltaproteobacteria bacterium]